MSQQPGKELVSSHAAEQLRTLAYVVAHDKKVLPDATGGSVSDVRPELRRQMATEMANLPLATTW